MVGFEEFVYLFLPLIIASDTAYRVRICLDIINIV